MWNISNEERLSVTGGLQYRHAFQLRDKNKIPESVSVDKIEQPGSRELRWSRMPGAQRENYINSLHDKFQDALRRHSQAEIVNEVAIPAAILSVLAGASFATPSIGALVGVVAVASGARLWSAREALSQQHIMRDINEDAKAYFRVMQGPEKA